MKAQSKPKISKKKRIVDSDDEEEATNGHGDVEMKSSATKDRGGNPSGFFASPVDFSDPSPPAKKPKTESKIASIFASPSKSTKSAKPSSNETKPKSFGKEAVIKKDENSDGSAPKAGPSKSKKDDKPIASIFAKPVKKEKQPEAEADHDDRDSPEKDGDYEGEEELDDEAEDEQEEEAAVKL
jgi:DNA ligase-1